MLGTEEVVRERAHLIWEREGRPAGRAEAHWSMAEAELAAETSKPARAAKPRKPAAKAAEAIPAPKRRKSAKTPA
jgi:hypothetical protein